MAVSANSIFNRAIVGQLQVGANIDIYEINDTPKFGVGAGFVRGDGAKFRYAHFGSNTEVAQLVGPISGEAYATMTWLNAVIDPASASTPAGELVAAGKAGSRYVQVQSTTAVSLSEVTADYYAGATMIVTQQLSGGEGYSYLVRGNTAKNTPYTGQTLIELEYPLASALDSTSDLLLVGSLFADVAPANTLSNYIVSGLSMSAPSANQYAWVMTRGLGAVVGSFPFSKGHAVTVDGMVGSHGCAAVQLHIGSETQVVGVAIVDSGDTSYSAIMVNVE